MQIKFACNIACNRQERRTVCIKTIRCGDPLKNGCSTRPSILQRIWRKFPFFSFPLLQGVWRTPGLQTPRKPAPTASLSLLSGVSCSRHALAGWQPAGPPCTFRMKEKWQKYWVFLSTKSLKSPLFRWPMPRVFYSKRLLANPCKKFFIWKRGKTRISSTRSRRDQRETIVSRLSRQSIPPQLLLVGRWIDGGGIPGTFS